MHIDIDEMAHLDSMIHRMDIRAKIISILAAAMIISSCSTIPAALISAAFAILLTLFSGIPLSYYLKKVYYPLIFLIPLFIFLPFSSGGEALISIWIFNIYTDGILISLLISIKVISIIILINIMISTATFRDTAAALRTLKIHDKMLNIILFTYRYFFVFFEALRKMKVALTLRGSKNRSTAKSLGTSANLAGSILVRSYEQTERIYQAMLLRGYSGRIISDKIFIIKRADILQSLIIIIIPLAVLFAELNGLLN
jgi:cobalt/nickel transport system permease protein